MNPRSLTHAVAFIPLLVFAASCSTDGTRDAAGPGSVSVTGSTVGGALSEPAPGAHVTAAAKPTGAVRIETVVFFDPRPVHGTFTVVTGSGLLGCDGGTFVDEPAGGFGIAIRKIFTCTNGGRGSFTFNFTPVIFVSPGVFRGHWNVLAPRSTGDFVGLRGEGDFSVLLTSLDPLQGEETLTGTIRFVP